MEQDVPLYWLVIVKKAWLFFKVWIKAFVWAVVFLMLANIFIFQIKSVETENMEASLLKGDIVFVNKLSFGARLPQTILAIPLTSWYSELIQLPYVRIPGTSSIQHHDIIAFNYPIESDPPTDKKSVYLKRCIGLPGETIQITEKKVFVNNVLIDSFPDNQYAYRMTLKENIDVDSLADIYELKNLRELFDDKLYEFYCKSHVADSIAKCSKVVNIRQISKLEHEREELVFPQSKFVHWNKDFFGPLQIPKKGMTISIHHKNIDLYKRIISVYESNELIVNSNNIIINGVEESQYTFEKNYYFVLDDNRDLAKDSRYWGFVPEDHIIGKAQFVCFSMNPNSTIINAFRWNRLFRFI
jgi:signal peptidase I